MSGVSKTIVRGADRWDSGLPFVIEHVRVGSASYRKWSNGFLEIWGKFHACNDGTARVAGSQRVNFPLQFTDHSSIVISGGLINCTSSYELNLGADREAVSYFRAHMTDKNSGQSIGSGHSESAQYYASGY